MPAMPTSRATQQTALDSYRLRRRRGADRQRDGRRRDGRDRRAAQTAAISITARYRKTIARLTRVSNSAMRGAQLTASQDLLASRAFLPDRA